MGSHGGFLSNSRIVTQSFSQCLWDNDSHSGFCGGSDGKESPAMQETWVRSLGREDPLQEGVGSPLQDSCLENSMGRGAHLTLF